ncbi:hypothetical protein NMG60_11014791 [Bertholletia excelsa]
MGLGGSLGRMSSYSKKQWRNLLWRMKVAVKKAVRVGRGSSSGGRQLKFQYDPWSYALNFDDGCEGLRSEEARKLRMTKVKQQGPGFPETTTSPTTWIYVIWVETHQG